MTRINGSAALKLDLGGVTAVTPPRHARGGTLRLASSGQLSGPGKYQVLAHRRRQAQIRARRLLEIIEGA